MGTNSKPGAFHRELSGSSGKQALKNVLSKYGCISDKLISCFENATALSAKELASSLQVTFANLISPAEYFTKEGIPCRKEKAAYIWVSTGLEDIYKRVPLYLGFARNSNKEKDACASDYFCYYVATREALQKNLAFFSENNPKEREAKNGLLKEIYDLLLIKGEWGSLPGYEVLEELLKLEEAKIDNDKKNGCEEKNCVFNNTRTKFAYNTGLISSYGNDIIIIADLDSSGNIVSRSVAQSKTQMKQTGFSDANIPPVRFYESRKDLIFSATAEDFDLDDIGRIQHIIDHRRERFPESAKNLPDDELVNKLRTSLEFDLKMTARNPYWAAPFYNVKQDEIQYLLPIFTDSLKDEPSLAMVVGKGEHYYEVRTVLTLQMAYANAACLASPPSDWLRTGNIEN